MWIGWWSLLAFLTLGFALEVLHGFKVSWYLEATHKTRWLMWTLSHAHGALLSLVHVAFGVTVCLIPAWNGRHRMLASRLLFVSSLLIPVGFFLGGIVFYSGDPGLGILLVPVGAVTLFAAVLLTALGTRSIRI
jgi:hypothetical protein